MSDYNEKDEITRVLCTMLEHNLCNVSGYAWGYDVRPKFCYDYLRVRPDSARVEAGGTINVGKKRMEQIVSAIKAAQNGKE